jgi:hypothetical protein
MMSGSIVREKENQIRPVRTNLAYIQAAVYRLQAGLLSLAGWLVRLTGLVPSAFIT